MKILAALFFVFAICVSEAAVAGDNQGYSGDEIKRLPVFNAHIHSNSWFPGRFLSKKRMDAEPAPRSNVANSGGLEVGHGNAI